MVLDSLLNKIHNIDCMKGMKAIPDSSIQLLIADPPYGISKTLNCKGQKLGSTAKIDFDFGDWDTDNGQNFTEWCKEGLKKTSGWAIIFCAKKDIGVYWNHMEKLHFKAIDSIVWQKPDPIPLNGKSKLLNAWESAVIGKRGGAYFGGYCTHNIFKYQAPKGKTRIHPTQKPLDLIAKLIELTTRENDIVFDPFIGSGTTAIACKKLNRQFIGFDNNLEYCNMAKKRLTSFKKQDVIILQEKISKKIR